MTFSKLDEMKLTSLKANYGLMTVLELQILYKESVGIYNSLPSYDIAKAKFCQDCIDFRKYGNLLVRSTLENENTLNYEISVKPVDGWREKRSRDESCNIVQELAHVVSANSYIPDSKDLNLLFTAFILPNERTDHLTLTEFLKEYGMPYTRTTTEFSFIEIPN